MAIQRKQVETDRETKNKALAEQLESKIDGFLKDMWELHYASITMPLLHEMPNGVQMILISKYQDAGWDLKFESSTHYDKQESKIVIQRYYG